jgi:molecular chaperone DnaK
MTVLIPLNTLIPITREGILFTTEDNQDCALIDVYEGERPNIKDNNLLGEFYLNGLPLGPRQKVSFVIIMEIDTNGILLLWLFEA